jgi:hypothetical protein
MKRLIYTLTLIYVIFGFSSCELETSDNGGLDGNWQLLSIDTLNTGGTNNMKDKQIFYAVQFHLINIYARNVNNEYITPESFFHFSQTCDSLILYSTDITQNDTYAHKDSFLTGLRPLGINSLEEHFKIETLNSKSMVLKSKELRLHFRSF